MSKRIFVDGNINSELCIIATDGQEINYFDYSDGLATSKKNNIYLGIVSRVEPSLQAAFIEFGSEKKAFLPFDEIHPSYFKIPHNDKLQIQIIIMKLMTKKKIRDNFSLSIENTKFRML